MMNQPQKKRKRQWLLWLNVLAVTCMLLAPTAPAFAQSDGSDGSDDVVNAAAALIPPAPLPTQADTPVVPGVPDLNGPPSQQQQPVESPFLPNAANRVYLPMISQPVQTAAEVQAAATTKTLDMKVLVIAADGKENNLPAIKATLDQLGIPYDVIIAANTLLTWDMLSNAVDRAYYQGVILTTGNLSYLNPETNQWESALDANEWYALWTFESLFGVRQVTWYTYPGWPDYGLAYVNVQDTTTQPLTAAFTAAGKTIFNDLNTNNPVTFKNAWVYLASITDTKTTTPLLSTSTGYPIASLHSYTDGRINLAITADSNPTLVHNLQLAYGAVNWVTKGLFLGYRKVWINPQVDDLFIDSDIWSTTALTDTTGLLYRLTGSDFNRAITWQRNTRTAYPLAKTLSLEWAFNGEGVSGIYPNDTLSSTVRTNKGAFYYVNHTYTHANLDSITTNSAITELQQNHQVAATLAFTTYSADTMVQPDISGLYNQQFADAAATYGIKYLISDTSRVGWDNPSPNAGFYWALKPSILVIPRKPTNLFYNLSTPAEWVSEYNCYYGPTGTCAGGAWRFWDHNLSYQEILDKESDFLLQYLLKWNIDPLMFHQANVRAYPSTTAYPNPSNSSLLGDLLVATLKKYTAVYNVPITFITQHDIGVKMTERMVYNNSQVKASVIPCQSITITTVNPAKIPLTGSLGAVPAGYTTSTETYNNQKITYISLAANQSVTVPVTCP